MVADLQKILEDIFNKSTFRKKIKEKIPYINKIESFKELNDLKFKGAVISEGNILKLYYECVVSPGFYSKIEEELVKKRIVKLLDLSSNDFNSGRPFDHKIIRMGFDDNFIQVFLIAYNSGYVI